jgi:hypothetical protein
LCPEKYYLEILDNKIISHKVIISHKATKIIKRKNNKK